MYNKSNKVWSRTCTTRLTSGLVSTERYSPFLICWPLSTTSTNSPDRYSSKSTKESDLICFNSSCASSPVRSVYKKAAFSFHMEHGTWRMAQGTWVLWGYIIRPQHGIRYYCETYTHKPNITMVMDFFYLGRLNLWEKGVWVGECSWVWMTLEADERILSAYRLQYWFSW